MNDTDTGQGSQLEKAMSHAQFAGEPAPYLLTKEMRVNKDGSPYVEADDE